MQNNKAILSPEGTYHIYNRANGSEQLFLSDENYWYFLRKYDEYINPVADTFCYCLMPNHFHFLVRVKSEEQLATFPKFQQRKRQNLQGLSNFMFTPYNKS
ncbi:hypothetical protein OOZ15_03500 [Galbibacter sp. EGI 63066]|uniref:hypothetical protein n=1 Tax=Galbibacter sp. EGI 63066 TaxID=2993559 RepID=UPI002248D80D|nr:hypothetical protein [Galbibacter sp. EGI 63066]MCX2678996.1 hypothetical protein [Galbibacter sp. EGI 63066]